jgi:hypothetical protein
VLDENLAAVSAHEFELADDAAEPGPAEVRTPFSFAIVPVDGDASRRITVQVDGLAVAGAPLVRRTALTGFLEGEQLLLPMFLASACRGVTCADGQTCVGGSCVNATVPPSSLSVARPGHELVRDSGAVDGGDAGLLCEETVACDGDCECSTSCCAVSCTSSPCVVVCGTRDVCSVGGPAEGTVDVACETMSTCDVSCEDAMACNVTCGVGARCVVHCPDTDCTLSGCMGDQFSECAGDVVTCRTECP